MKVRGSGRCGTGGCWLIVLGVGCAPARPTEEAPRPHAQVSRSQPADAVASRMAGGTRTAEEGTTSAAAGFPALCVPEESPAHNGDAARCRELLELEERIEAGWPREEAQRGAAVQEAERRLEALCRSESCRFREPSALGVGPGPDRLAMGARYLEALLELSLCDLTYGSEDVRASTALRLLHPLLDAEAALRDRARLQAARAHLARGDGEDAVQLLRGLAERYPQHAETQGALGVAYLSLGQVQRSVTPLSRAVQMEPTVAERHIALGTARFLLGELEPAERNFRAALAHAQVTEVRARAHGDLGALLLVLGRAADGRAHLQRAATLSPQSATYLASWSYAELLLERPARAEELARKSAKLDPQLVSAWINLGLALVAQRRVDEARASFEKAAALDPTDPRPRNNLQDLDELGSE